MIKKAIEKEIMTSLNYMFDFYHEDHETIVSDITLQGSTTFIEFNKFTLTKNVLTICDKLDCSDFKILYKSTKLDKSSNLDIELQSGLILQITTLELIDKIEELQAKNGK